MGGRMGGRRSGSGRAASGPPRRAGTASRPSRPSTSRRRSSAAGAQRPSRTVAQVSRPSGGRRNSAPARGIARASAGGRRARSSGDRRQQRMAQVQARERLQGLVDERAASGGSVGEQWFTRSGLSDEQRQSAMDYAAERGYSLGNKWADIKNPLFNEANEQVLRASKERTPEQIAFRDKLKAMYGRNFEETWVPGLMQPGQKGYDASTGGGNWVYSQGPTDVESLRAWYRGDPNEGVDTALRGRDRSQFTLEGLFSGSSGQRNSVSTGPQPLERAQQTVTSRRSARRSRRMARAEQYGGDKRQSDFSDQSTDAENYRYGKFSDDYRSGYNSLRNVTLESAIDSPFRNYGRY